MRAIFSLLIALSFSPALADGFVITPGGRFVLKPEDMERFLAEKRICIRAHTADAKAAGVRTSDEAIKYLAYICLGKFGWSMIEGDEIDTRTGEITDTGILRGAFRDEWAAFLETTQMK
jgi:hypothetical protein